LNVLAFSNHLLFDVCALTVFDRESLKVQDVDQYVPEILAAWNKLQPVFARSGFPKFVGLASAIPLKTPLEQRLVDVYSVWMSASAALTLPIMEEILANEWIPQFERTVVEAYPAMAKEAAMRVAERNGPADSPYGRTLGVLWCARGEPVGLADESVSRTLPVVDPQMDLVPEQPQYLKLARAQREYYAEQRYLGIGFRRGTRFVPTWDHHPFTWTDEAFWMFDNVAKMCQFSNLFRGLACGQFEQLLNVEYPQNNLPFVILASNNPKDAPELPYLNADLNNNGHLDQYYTFVGVAYRRAVSEIMPGLFRNPMRAARASEPYAAVAYATVRVFIPKPRLTWQVGGPATPPGMPAGGVPGQIPPLPPSDGGGPPPSDPDGPLPPLPGAGATQREWVRQGPWRWRPRDGQERGWVLWQHWGLTNQHWTVQLVPSGLSDAGRPFLATILQADLRPLFPEFSQEGIVPPNLGNLADGDIGWISPH
jgi:hypothetical protein